MVERQDIDVSQIQGNVIPGFKTDFQVLLFLQFSPDNPGAARAFIKTLVDAGKVTASLEVQKSRGNQSPPRMNIAFSHRGLEALQIGRREELPREFRLGMAERFRELGDMSDSAPEHWDPPFNRRAHRAGVHALILIGADDEESIAQEVKYYRDLARRYCARIVGESPIGRLHDPHTGRSHFGFKEKASQPRIKGLRRAYEIAGLKPAQGVDARDLDDRGAVQPGEFVFGYPTESEEKSAAHDELLKKVPWLDNGSFLVYRKLVQDVDGFNTFLTERGENQYSEDAAAAKLVGRHRSGARIQHDMPIGGNDPEPRPDDDDFGYQDDLGGKVVPCAAHIRRANPRDLLDNPGQRRLLRRSFFFGDIKTEERGLSFICYQSSIADQFEWVMKNIRHNEEGVGRDPIGTPFSEATNLSEFKASPDLTWKNVRSWITTAGGEYFFVPSLKALHDVFRSDELPA